MYLEYNINIENRIMKVPMEKYLISFWQLKRIHLSNVAVYEKWSWMCMKHWRYDIFIILTEFCILSRKKEREETFANVSVTNTEVLRLELFHSALGET